VLSHATPSKAVAAALHVPRRENLRVACPALRCVSGGRSPAQLSARRARPANRAVGCRSSCAGVAAHLALRAARLFAARHLRPKRRLAAAVRRHRSALKLRGLISRQPSIHLGVAAPPVSFRSAGSSDRPRRGPARSKPKPQRRAPRPRRDRAPPRALEPPGKVGCNIGVRVTRQACHLKTRIVLNRGQRVQNTLYNTPGVAQEGKFRHKTGGSHCTEMRENL
jgi:hypothetical protein